MRVLASPATSNRASNPYNWLLYTHVRALGVEVYEYSRTRLLTGAYDIWHAHWPESSLSEPQFTNAAVPAIKLIAMMTAARRRGVKFVWTIHNTAEHERQHPRLARWFWKAFVARVDACISLTAAGERETLNRFPALSRLPRFVIPHGHYRDAYPNRTDRQSARAQLGLAPDASVIAFVGQIRAYKNVPALIRAFRAVRDDRATLTIAGDPRPAAVAAEVYHAARGDPRVRLHLGFVSDEELVRHIAAADLLVFPFRDVLNSGSIMLALSLDRPILIPPKPSLLELQTAVGQQWVQTYDEPLTADALRIALYRAKETVKHEAPRLELFDWRSLAEQTIDAYRQVVSASAASVSPVICNPGAGA